MRNRNSSTAALAAVLSAAFAALSAASAFGADAKSLDYVPLDETLEVQG